LVVSTTSSLDSRISRVDPGIVENRADDSSGEQIVDKIFDKKMDRKSLNETRRSLSVFPGVGKD